MNIAARFKLKQGDFALDTDFSIPASGICAIFGPSGSGKTTLLRAIAGLTEIPGGYLRVGDTVWQEHNYYLPTHRRQLAYVFQEANLFAHLNVRKNISYSLKRKGSMRKSADDKQINAADQAIALLNLEHMLDRMPHTLSGGERQRVAIARALASQPELLLMDEPLASLDQERKREILPYIQNLQQELNIPVLYVSHSADEVAQLANHLILLRAGTVIASGEIGDMLTRMDQPLAHADDAEALIEATVAGHDEGYHLSYLSFAGGSFAVSRLDLPIGSAVRLRVAARDVSVTLEPQADTSILNIFPAVIDAMTPEGAAQMTIRLRVGDVPLLARLTRKSASLLNLQVGKQVYAQAKSAAVLS